MLATPIKDVEERKLKIGEFYSGMTPYASWQTNYTYTENNSLGSSATVGINVGASAGVQNGQNMSITDSTADTENSSVTETESQSDSLSSSEATAKSNSKNPSSQAYAYVFSANFAADCVKNPCRATARLRIFALSATKLCSKIRTHFL